MLSRSRHGIRVLFYFGAELLVVAAAFFAALWVRERTSPWWGPELVRLREYWWLLPSSVVLWGGLLWGLNTYAGFRSRSGFMHAVSAASTCLIGVLLLFSGVALLHRGQFVNRSLIGIFGVLAFTGLTATRWVAMAFLAHYTQKGYDRHYVVIGGIQPDAVALAEMLEGVAGAVFQVRGFVAEDPSEVGRSVGRWKVMGTFGDLPTIASGVPVDEVYLLPTRGPLEGNLDLVRRCEAMGMTIHLRLAAFEQTISRLELSEAAGGDYLRFTTAPRNEFALLLKRILDVVGASLLLGVLSPLLGLVALLVRLGSRGPAIFRQERAGMNGRIFTLYKFRTMVEGAEKAREGLEAHNEMDGPVFKIKKDPRVTGLGRLLRRTSIDELPQLWNVVKGDMSLVGPRPLPTYEVEKFEPWHRRRMSMRPGITCLWQVMGRNRVTNFAEWMKLDLDYVDRWSLGLDLRILLRTIPAVLGARGAY